MKKVFFLLLFFCHQLQAQKNNETTNQHVLLSKLSEHTCKVTAIDVSLSGKYMISGDLMGEVIVWNLITRKSMYKFTPHKRSISSVKFSSDGTQFLTASLDGYIRIFNTEAKNEIAFVNLKDEVIEADFTMSKNQIVAHHGGYRYFIWNTSNGNILKSTSFLARIKYFKVSKNNPYILIAHESTVRNWNYVSDTEIFTDIDIHKSTISSLSMSSEGNFGISGSNNKLILWDLKHNHHKIYHVQKPQITTAFLNPIVDVVLVFNHSLLAYYNLTDAKITNSFNLPESCNSLVSNAKGSLLALGGNSGSIYLYFMNEKFVKEGVEVYVHETLRKWYEKDAFEKTNDYFVRTQEGKIQVKADSLIKIYYTQNFGQFSPNWKKYNQSYNADKEEFEVIFENFRKIYFKVPLQEAKSFDFNTCTYKNAVYSIDSLDKICLVNLDMLDKNGKTYSYKNKDASFLKSYQLYKKQFPNIPAETIANTIIPIEVKQPIDNKKEENTQVLVEKKPIIKPADVDNDLPKTITKNSDAIAIVIGNTNYQKTKKVNFGVYDAQIMKKYLIETMGFEEDNILYLEDATYGDFKVMFGEKNNPKGKLYNMIKPNKSDLFVFYSGHGAPSLKDKKGYFIPVDCDPEYIELLGFPVDIFYENIGKSRAKSVTIAIDACFSGVDIYENISPIVIKAKGVTEIQSGALLASCGLQEVSCWYNEKSHGMFTYFFLKAIHNKNADLNKDNKLTLREIYQFTIDEAEGVPYYARRTRGVEQKPTLQGQNLDRVLVEFDR